MNTAAIKSDILKKIEAMNASQLREFYGLLANYFNAADNTEEWHLLSHAQKEIIEKGIAEADNNILTPLSEVTARLRKKYGLNG